METLRQAFDHGGLEELERLLAKGVANVNAGDAYGETFLHWASLYGLGDVVKLLLAHGANANATTNVGDNAMENGASVLHSAVSAGDVETVEALLVHGADPNVTHRYGGTPLLRANNSRVPLRVVKTLLEYGADPNTDGISALHYVSRMGWGCVEKVEILLAYGADVNAQGPYGNRQTPLKEATQANIITMLLKNGADVEDGALPLYRASKQICMDSVDALLAGGVDIDIIIWGQTVFQHACYSKYFRDRFQTIKELVQRGANVNALDLHGKTALHLACEFGQLEVISVLFTLGIDPNIISKKGKTALQWAAERDRTALVTTLLSNGVDVDFPGKSGKTALHLACAEGSYNSAAALLTHGAVPNARDQARKTPLHWATRSYQTVKLLLKRGADIEAVTKGGMTALHLASAYGELHVVELLVARGLDPNQKDKNGNTALHLAASCHHSSVVTFLLEHGDTCDPNLTNEAGQTPLSLCLQRQPCTPRLAAVTACSLMSNGAVFNAPSVLFQISAKKKRHTAMFAARVRHWDFEPHSQLGDELVELLDNVQAAAQTYLDEKQVNREQN